MRVLIAYGSKQGGTAGIARRVGQVLSEAGHEVEVRAGHELDGLGGYDAVIVGGGLYANLWPRSVRRFVRRHVDELRRMPVWMFSSEPLDDSASKAELPPSPPVARLIALVEARGHVTFGGRLGPDSKGFIARAMGEQGHGGDFRDTDAVARWAEGVADKLATIPTPVTTPTTRAQRVARRALVGLCWFTGLTAAGGGIELMAWPEGNELLPPVSLLEDTVFASYFVPGLLLTFVVGLLNLIAGSLVLRRHRAGPMLALVAGCSLTIWLTTEMLLLRTFHWLHVLFLAAGVATIVLAAWLESRRRASLAERERAAPAPVAHPRPRGQEPTPAITS